MKVLHSTIAGLALAQDRWNSFDYDYGFGTAERNQISQSAQVPNVLIGQAAGIDAAGASNPSALTAGSTLGTIFNPYLDGSGLTDDLKYSFPTYLGNGMMCWFCEADSVYNCFNSGKFQVCSGQDYFCYYHERRKIGHYFNRREKYIDNYASTNTDLFLVRVNNEAWNLDSHGLPNSSRNPTAEDMSDNFRPTTDIFVQAGCQQPQTCLRQQMQNQAINIGVSFTGTSDAEVGNIQTGTGGDFTTYIHPTSRRNVKEGLCRIGKDWTYYSGKLWHYDDGGEYTSNDRNSSGTLCTTANNVPTACVLTINSIDTVNSVPIQVADDGVTDGTSTNSANVSNSPMDDASVYDFTTNTQTGEATAVYGRNPNTSAGDHEDDIPSTLLWGRGIYDAHDSHGHQFWHERESWYNGMRPNGFPEQHYHGGKGSESVCHFCCNPASSDGMFCNRRLLDNTPAVSATPLNPTNQGTYGLTFSNGAGNWMKSDVTQDYSDTTSGTSDNRNLFVDTNYVRADNPSLKILETPMANAYNTNSAWMSEHRYHGMFRNPDTQVSQDFQIPLFLP